MDRQAFYAALRRDARVFGKRLSNSQVRGIEGILAAFRTHGDGRDKTLAYALATAYHETARRMVPVREGLAATDLGARRAVNALARKRGPNSAVAKYARPAGPHGHVYYGRGHVQLTWIDNYAKSSKDAGTDLVKTPDAMLDPETSAKVLFRGLLDGRWNRHGHGIAHYLPAAGPQDLKGARRTVNVTDKWDEIADYYQAFMDALGADSGTAGGGTVKRDHILKRGARGDYVVELQRSLNTLGFSLKVDGHFGPATEEAVRAFQVNHGLTADGWAGNRTMAAIGRALADKASRPRIETAERNAERAGHERDAAQRKAEKASEALPTIEDAASRKTGLWQWVTSLLGGGGAGGAFLFGMEWQTVAAIGGATLAFLIVLVLFRRQIVAAVRDLKREIG